MYSKNGISINPVKKNDVLDIILLQKEFDVYLQRFSKNKRKRFSVQKHKRTLLRDGFGSKRAFQGFIARSQNKALGYVLYHFGYDPDEMEGRVIYVIDLFVTGGARRLGIGSILMKKVMALCKNTNCTGIYFGVWLKNKPAIQFYKKLGANWIKDVPFMHWNKD